MSIYDPWFLKSKDQDVRLRLLCFPYAGGNPSIFLPWARHCPPGVQIYAVQYPGRGSHSDRQPIRNLDYLLDELSLAVQSIDDRPFAFFGHSLGAIIAFELAQRMRIIAPPKHVFASGCAAPVFWPPESGSAIGRLAKAEFMKRIQSLDEFSPDIFEFRSLLDYVIPVVHADYSLIAQYRYQPRPPLNIPMTVFLGRDDERVDAMAARSWCWETRYPIATHWFQGGHLFLKEQGKAVIENVMQVLLLK